MSSKKKKPSKKDFKAVGCTMDIEMILQLKEAAIKLERRGCMKSGKVTDIVRYACQYFLDNFDCK